MENMEDKLGAILNNPQMMQQIMAMAQTLGNSSPARPQEEKQESQPVDVATLQKLSGFAGQSGINRDEKQLLQALAPYLSRDRVTKLENAMRAAKMARLASSFLGNGSLQNLMGR